MLRIMSSRWASFAFGKFACLEDVGSCWWTGLAWPWAWQEEEEQTSPSRSITISNVLMVIQLQVHRACRNLCVGLFVMICDRRDVFSYLFIYMLVCFCRGDSVAVTVTVCKLVSYTVNLLYFPFCTVCCAYSSLPAKFLRCHIKHLN